MAGIHEIAPGVYRMTVYLPAYDLEFSHFLVDDDQPLLFHTGLRGTFPEVSEALSRLIDPARLRWISFSHFESDECGALNQWLEIAPQAEPVCNLVGALVNLNDFSNRPARVLEPEERLVTGKRRFRFVSTPHLPHGWDAGVLFEETGGTLFCSDLFHQVGRQQPLDSGDILGRARQALAAYQRSPFAGYVPYRDETGRQLDRLAELRPGTLAVMHGSSFQGDCAQALRGLAEVFRELLGEPAASARAERG